MNITTNAELGTKCSNAGVNAIVGSQKGYLAYQVMVGWWI